MNTPTTSLFVLDHARYGQNQATGNRVRNPVKAERHSGMIPNAVPG